MEMGTGRRREEAAAGTMHESHVVWGGRKGTEEGGVEGRRDLGMKRHRRTGESRMYRRKGMRKEE